MSDQIAPITHDRSGFPAEIGFEVATGAGSCEMDVSTIDVYLREGTDFVNIVTDADTGHVFFDISDIDAVIEALMRIRVSRRA